MAAFFYKFLFILLNFKVYNIPGKIRNTQYRLRGMQIGTDIALPKIYVTWPHKVLLGNHSTIEHNVYFKYDGPYSTGVAINIGENVFIGFGTEFNIKYGITIGEHSLIASGCKFIDHDHGMALSKELLRLQECKGQKIHIADNVWLGANTIILKGVTIGKGAIVGAGAIVNKSIPPNEIWGGIPARKIGERK